MTDTIPHSWTDSQNQLHVLPRIDYTIEARLKRWGIVDLYSVTTRPDKWDDLFERLVSDREFIVNLLFALEHDDLGTEEQQQTFAQLFNVSDPDAERGTSDIVREASEALLGAVVDFFPSETRESTRQFVSLFLIQRATKGLTTSPTDNGSDSCDSETDANGSNGCSEPSGTTDTDLACDKSASDTTERCTTTK